MSCPAYFDLEVYSDDESQCYNKYQDYNKWLGVYWKNTVKNCMSILEEDGYFILIVKDEFKKYKLAEDMTSICAAFSLTLVDKINIRTSKNHLSGKKESKKVTKNSEIIFVFKK
jgi:hypothetical protein